MATPALVHFATTPHFLYRNVPSFSGKKPVRFGKHGSVGKHGSRRRNEGASCSVGVARSPRGTCAKSHGYRAALPGSGLPKQYATTSILMRATSIRTDTDPRFPSFHLRCMTSSMHATILPMPYRAIHDSTLPLLLCVRDQIFAARRVIRKSRMHIWTRFVGKSTTTHPGRYMACNSTSKFDTAHIGAVEPNIM